MLILLEGDFPAPLVDALHAVLQLYRKENVRVLTDSPTVEEDPNEATIVFMVNWQKRISPAIWHRYRSGYCVFAFRYPQDNTIDPFRFAITVLKLLPELIKVIETEKRPFLYSFGHKTNRLKDETNSR
jgi:hypothetical protein